MTKSDGSRYEPPKSRRLADSETGRGDACVPNGSGADGACNHFGLTASSCAPEGNQASTQCNAYGQTARSCYTNGAGATASCSGTGNTVSP